MIKKILAFLLAAFLLLGFAGCGSKEAPEGEKTGEPGQEEDFSELEGYVFELQQEWDPKSMLYTYDLETPIGDTMKSHYAATEAKLGVTFKILQHNEESVLQTEMAAGSCSAEVIESAGNSRLFTYADAGILQSYNEHLDVIDYLHSTKYGYPNQLECAMINSEAYAICPTLWPEVVLVDNGLIVFNEDILSSMDLGDPRQYLEDKSWTWDNFLQLITDATHQEGENTVYGFCTNPTELAHLALLSNGVQTVVKEGDTLVTDLTSQKCIEAIDFVQSLYKDYRPYVCAKYGGSKWNIDNFLNGDAVLELSYGRYATKGDLAFESKIHYGILPFPCGPACTYGKWAHELECIYGFAIPITADMPDYAVVVLDKLFDAPEGYDMSLADYHKANTFVNPVDAETYAEIATGGRYTYWTVQGHIFANAVGSNLTTPATSLINSYVPQLQTFIDKYMVPNYDYLAEYIFS